ncbi:hypothetical protein AB0I61_24700 [Polymorphospora rubra]|uniref:hypothetical protein n=1 Tax=Polymorphospora rubra TaxID=338584 RepID=UPI0033F6041A
MRTTGPAPSPALGRIGAEVFRLDLGALSPDVGTDGDYVTDDLCGWLAIRQARQVTGRPTPR